jgi:uncharacterized protein YacL
MSAVLIARLVGLIIFGIIGIFSGTPVYKLLLNLADPFPLTRGVVIAITALVLALIGFLLTPWLTIKPFNALRRLFSKASPQVLISGLVGLVIGLIVGGLLSYPLSLLPQPFGSILPIVCVVLMGYLGVMLFSTRHADFANLFRSVSQRMGPKTKNLPPPDSLRKVLVDTSAIIDGRIADIVKTGFLGGALIIPKFVLNELQFVSDSANSLRRQRGRRGIEVLTELQQNSLVPVTIEDLDIEGVHEVDERLIMLARQMAAPILTNDYNLNRIAELQGVEVLNVNDLANAVKVIILPGESFVIRVIQEGKEFNQGVGYLDDGTMVVIENGQRYLDKDIPVTVTKILQTSAGRMIFARPE